MYMNDTQANMIRAGLRQAQHALDEAQRLLHDRSVAVTHGKIRNVIDNLRCEAERLEEYDTSLAPSTENNIRKAIEERLDANEPNWIE